MFHKIDKIVKKQLNKVNLENIAQAAYVCYRANEIAQGRFQALSFRQGVLEIALKNNLEMLEIQAEQPKIIQTINQALKKDLVKKLRYRVR